MLEVSVRYCPSGTGMVIYDTNGTNTFTNSSFSNNRVTRTHKQPVGGGAFNIEFTYYPATASALEQRRQQPSRVFKGAVECLHMKWRHWSANPPPWATIERIQVPQWCLQSESEMYNSTNLLPGFFQHPAFQIPSGPMHQWPATMHNAHHSLADDKTRCYSWHGSDRQLV